jgi:hypothetical protein
MLNLVPTLPAFEAGLLGLSDHILSSVQAILSRRAAEARMTGWFEMALLRSDFHVDFKSSFHSFRVLDEASAMCFFAELEDAEEI